MILLQVRHSTSCVRPTCPKYLAPPYYLCSEQCAASLFQWPCVAATVWRQNCLLTKSTSLFTSKQNSDSKRKWGYNCPCQQDVYLLLCTWYVNGSDVLCRICTLVSARDTTIYHDSRIIPFLCLPLLFVTLVQKMLWHRLVFVGQVLQVLRSCHGYTGCSGLCGQTHASQTIALSGRGARRRYNVGLRLMRSAPAARCTTCLAQQTQVRLNQNVHINIKNK